VATLYLLADEPVKNQQQQDCHLVAIIYAPDVSDSGALRKEAENKIKEEVDKKFALGERFALRFTDKDTASEYLRADPGACWHSYSKNPVGGFWWQNNKHSSVYFRDQPVGRRQGTCKPLAMEFS
jgi:hypothetical protein